MGNSRASTTYLHRAALIYRMRVFAKSETKDFSKDCVVYAINAHLSPYITGLFEGNFLQLWKPWVLVIQESHFHLDQNSPYGKTCFSARVPIAFAISHLNAKHSFYWDRAKLVYKIN